MPRSRHATEIRSQEPPVSSTAGWSSGTGAVSASVTIYGTLSERDRSQVNTETENRDRQNRATSSGSTAKVLTFEAPVARAAVITRSSLASCPGTRLEGQALAE